MYQVLGTNMSIFYILSHLILTPAPGGKTMTCAQLKEDKIKDHLATLVTLEWKQSGQDSNIERSLAVSPVL